MMEASAAQNIKRAFDLVSKCGVELNGLCQTIDDLLENALGNLSQASGIVRDGSKIKKSGMDSSSWVCSAYAMSFGLKSSEEETDAERYLGYQISMTGEGIPDFIDFPLLHVFLWDKPVDFNTDYFMAYPLDNTASLEESRIFYWNDDDQTDWLQKRWLFSLDLTSMNSRQDIVTSLIDPVLALLAGKPAKEALPDSLGGLVIYPDDVDLIEE